MPDTDKGPTPAEAFVAEWLGVAGEHPHVDTDLVTYPREGPDVVTLNSVWSNRERGKGHATRAMRALLDLADGHGVTVTGEVYWLTYDIEYGDYDEADLDRLDALNDARLDHRGLIAWYRKLGFDIAEPDPAIDDRDLAHWPMRREPVAPVPVPMSGC